MAKIAIVSVPMLGHQQPLLQLSKQLAARGNKVVLYTTLYYDRARVEEELLAAGVQLVDLESPRVDDFFQRQRGPPFTFYCEQMLPRLRALLLQSCPDVLVSDFTSVCGPIVAAELHLPSVVVMPGVVMFLHEVLGMPFRHLQLGPFSLGLRHTKFLLMQLLLPRGDTRDFIALVMKTLASSLVLVHGFWGLDVPVPLPPNYIVTGPLLAYKATPSRLAPGSASCTRHTALVAWLDAVPAGVPVVLVVTGSVWRLAEWRVRTLYQGLCASGCRVVWSLREAARKLLPPGAEDNRQFFLSPWIPQQELLGDPRVKAVVTHCGFGSMTECLAAGKPMVAMPGSDDQPMNARMVVQAHAAVGLGIPAKAPPTGEDWPQPKFGAAEVAAAVEAVTGTGPDSAALLAGAELLSRLMRRTPGLAGTVELVEAAAQNGLAHLCLPKLRAGSMGFSGSRGSSKMVRAVVPGLGLVLGGALVCMLVFGKNRRW